MSTFQMFKRSTRIARQRQVAVRAAAARRTYPSAVQPNVQVRQRLS